MSLERMVGAMAYLIREDDLSGPEIAELLDAHFVHALEHSPAESIHAFGVDRLRVPEITFWTVWSDGVLSGCGALLELSATHGEIKSMHTSVSHRGRGVATLVLEHILSVAGTRSYDRLSLETGTMEAFAPARALYSRFGFTPCAPFGDHVINPNSVCMTRHLRPSG
ncbi:GNAT family N-acetyltransferase [Rhodothermus sp. AH-315-K08]|nr:GNAT family N-acetyltransferase [Rhodothermus sp. AH-315-K08]